MTGTDTRPLTTSPCVDLNGPPGASTPRLTVVVPTRNEQEVIPLLLQSLGDAFMRLPIEVLFVDDSDDDTPATAAAHAALCPKRVRMLHRAPGARSAGLAGAVLAGAREARGAWVLVMDADLQHPPEAAAAIARTALGHEAEIVIGTRHAGSGSSAGLGGAGRSVASNGSRLLAKAFFPRCLATVSDPMSGLFAFRKDAVDLDRLNPLGFKILLEILVRNPSARVAEVAYTFAPRAAGRSKASLREGITYLRHLARLRAGRRQSGGRSAELGRLLGFGLVGVSGIGVNTAALWFFYSLLHMPALLGAALATQVSTAWNFALIEALVYRGTGRGTRPGRGVRFFALNNLLLLGRLPVLAWLVSIGVGVLTSNVITLVLLFLLRFLFSDRIIYGTGDRPTGKRDPARTLVDPAASATTPSTTHGAHKRTRYLSHRYDIAGQVTIGSQVPLPELEFFRAQWLSPAGCDIVVRVSDIGRRTPHHRVALTELAREVDGCPASLRYEEQLGRVGANFRVDLGHPISVEVSPLLAHSPHVVYTNVIEALLRFVLVPRGWMLLHSACLDLGGTGVMLSALTDTGKTATVLRLLREHGGRFLSDDMTLIDAGGHALCFPKPLTISAHTLRAVHADDLTRTEWMKLMVQSRLHSKEGRSFALTLARLNLPIMAINALTQIVVPPPKYAVDRLVPCAIGTATAVRDLFVIERGAPRLADVPYDEALRRLLGNTEDAYGFPPFRYFAPALTIDGLDHAQLRVREREILAGFLSGVRVRALASDSFGWADEIPRLLALEPRDTAPVAHVNGVERPHWMWQFDSPFAVPGTARSASSGGPP
ncbi:MULTISPECIES: glycosyltransferase [unclassified Streptomyces]|uniref:glycosyltransferase n=1 Tax=unclassified Streptomyces TaxID=2593676 RepID=UPI0023669C92|nr:MULTISPECIES: glycosyltransferase [unclassified Streptomyces]MDF3147844.1 glycosyltransferase [Streptomyces sp. T21Q-yed]WDF43030.1 glycosyltransferase [Streptomyces sp. T12]